MIKRRNGFSLIELVVVMGILAVVVAVATPSITRLRASARDGKRKADVEKIRSALEIYRSNQSPPVYPANVSSLSPDYIPSWPSDPLSTQVYVYKQVGNGYAVCAHLENEGAATANCTGANECGVNCNYQVGP